MRICYSTYFTGLIEGGEGGRGGAGHFVTYSNGQFCHRTAEGEGQGIFSPSMVNEVGGKKHFLTYSKRL